MYQPAINSNPKSKKQPENKQKKIEKSNWKVSQNSIVLVVEEVAAAFFVVFSASLKQQLRLQQ